MVNTFFEIHIDENCAHNQVIIVPLMSGFESIGLVDNSNGVRVQLTSASYEKLMDLPKQSFNDNTLIKICTNI